MTTELTNSLMTQADKNIAAMGAESVAREAALQPLTKDDVHQLYQQRRYSEIEQARQDGRLTFLEPTEPTKETTK